MNVPAADVLAIADCAVWSRSPDWSHRCFPRFLAGLYGEGLFLPPLLAYELRSAAELSEHVLGKNASLGGDLGARSSLVRWAHGVTVGRLSASASDWADARERAAFRLASAVALSLMDRVDVSPLRGSDGFDPRGLVALELGRLRGRRHGSGCLAEAWSFIESVSRTGRFHELVPLTESLARIFHTSCRW
jgi:hypothetical protein